MQISQKRSLLCILSILKNIMRRARTFFKCVQLENSMKIMTFFTRVSKSFIGVVVSGSWHYFLTQPNLTQPNTNRIIQRIPLVLKYTMPVSLFNMVDLYQSCTKSEAYSKSLHIIWSRQK